MFMMGEAKGLITLDISDLESKAGQVASTLGNLDQAGQGGMVGWAEGIKRNEANINAMGRTMLGVGGAMTAVWGSGIRQAANFEQGMNNVKALTGATGQEFKNLERSAVEMSSTTRYTANEVADGMGYLAMAGFNTTQIIGGLPGVLNLAAAANMDLGKAADVTSNIMTAFGIPAENAVDIADKMVYAFTNSNTSMAQMGDAMKYVAPVAAAAGISIDETAAAIGLLGDAGFQGSMAGTILRMAISQLISPSAAARKTMNEMGISIKDTEGRMLPLADIMEQFPPVTQKSADAMETLAAQAEGLGIPMDNLDGTSRSLTDVLADLEAAGVDTSGMMDALGTEADTVAAIMDIFGVRAGPGMLALLAQGSDALRDYTAEIENSGGTAERVAKTQLEGLKGTLTLIGSAWEAFMIKAMSGGSLQILNVLAQGLLRFIGILNQIPGPILGVAAAIFGFTGIMLTFGGMFLLALPKIANFILMINRLRGTAGALGAVANMMVRLASFARLMAFAFTGIGAILAAFAVAVRFNLFGIGDAFRTFGESFRFFSDLGNRFTAFFKALGSALQSFDSGILNTIGENISNFGFALDAFFKGFGVGAEKGTEEVKKMFSGFAELQEDGTTWHVNTEEGEKVGEIIDSWTEEDGTTTVKIRTEGGEEFETTMDMVEGYVEQEYTVEVEVEGENGLGMLDRIRNGLEGVQSFADTMNMDWLSRVAGAGIGAIDTIQRIQNAFSSARSSGMDPFRAGLTALIAGFPRLSSVLNPVIDGWDRFREGASRAVEAGRALVSAGISNAISGIATGFSALRSAASNVWDRVTSGAQTAVSTFGRLREAFSTFRSLGVDPVRSALMALGATFPRLRGATTALVSGWNTLRSAGSRLRGAIEDKLGVARRAIATYQAWRSVGINPLASALMALGTHFPRLRGLVMSLNYAWGLAAEGVNRLREAFSNLRAGDISGFFRNLLQGVGFFAAAIAKLALDLVTGLVNAIRGVDWSGFGSAIWDGIKTALTWVGDQVLDFLKNLFRGDTDAVGGGAGDGLFGKGFTDAMYEQLLESLEYTWDMAWEDFKSYVRGKANDLGDWILNVGVPTVTGWIVAAAGALWDLLKQAGGWAGGLLAELGDWILETGIPNVTGWITEFAANAWEALQSAAGWAGDVTAPLTDWSIEVGIPTLSGWIDEAATWLGDQINAVIDTVVAETWTFMMNEPQVIWGFDVQAFMQDTVAAAIVDGVQATLNLILEPGEDSIFTLRNALIAAVVTMLAGLVITGGIGAILPLLAVGALAVFGTALYNAIRNYLAANPTKLDEIKVQIGEIWADLKEGDFGTFFQTLEDIYKSIVDIVNAGRRMNDWLNSLPGPLSEAWTWVKRLTAAYIALNIAMAVGGGMAGGGKRGPMANMMKGLWALALFPFNLIFRPLRTLRNLLSIKQKHGRGLPFVASMRGLLSLPFKAVGVALKGLVNSFKGLGAVGAVLGGIGKAVGQLGGVLAGARTRLLGLEGIGKRLGNWYLGSRLATAYGYAQLFVKEGWQRILNEFRVGGANIAREAKVGASRFGTWLANYTAYLGAWRNMMVRGITRTGNEIARAFGILARNPQHLRHNLGQMFQTLAGRIPGVSAITRAFGALRNLFSPRNMGIVANPRAFAAFSALDDAVRRIGSRASALRNVGSAFSRVGSAVTSMANRLPNVTSGFGALARVASRLSPALRTVAMLSSFLGLQNLIGRAGGLSGIWDQLRSSFDEGGMRGVISMIARNIANGIREIPNMIRDAISGLRDMGLSGMWDWIQDSAQNIDWRLVGTILVIGLAAMVAGIPGLLLAIVGPFLWEWLYDSLSGVDWGALGSRLLEGLRSAFDSVISWFGSMGPQILSGLLAALSFLQGALLSAASAAMSGLLSGLIAGAQAVWGWLSQLGGWLRGAVGGAWDWLREKAGEVWDGFLEGLVSYGQQAWDWLSQAGEWLRSAISGAWDWLREKAGEVWDGFVEGLVQFGQAAWNWLSRAGDWLRTAISGAWDFLREKAAEVWDGVVEAFVQFGQSAWNWLSRAGDWLRTAVSGAWDFLREKAAEVWEGVVEAFVQAGQAAWNWLSSVGDWLRTAVSGAWDFLREKAGEVWDGVLEAMVQAGMEVWSWLSSVGAWLQTAISGSWDWLRAKGVELMAGLYDGVTTGWDLISGWFGDMIGRIMEAIGLGSAWDWLRAKGVELFRYLYEGLTTGWDLVQGWLSDIVSRIQSAVDLGGAWDWLRAKGVELFRYLYEGLNSGWDLVQGWISDITSRIQSAVDIGGAWDWLRTKGVELFYELQQGLVTGWEAVQEWLGNIPGWIRDAVGDIQWAEGLKAVGEAIMDQMLGGIIERWNNRPKWLGGSGGSDAATAQYDIDFGQIGEQVEQGIADSVGDQNGEILGVAISGLILEGVKSAASGGIEQYPEIGVGIANMIEREAVRELKTPPEDLGPAIANWIGEGVTLAGSSEEMTASMTDLVGHLSEGLVNEIGTGEHADGASISEALISWFGNGLVLMADELPARMEGFNVILADAMTAEIGTMDGTSLSNDLSDWFQRAVDISQDRIRTAFTGFNNVVAEAMTAELGTMDGTSLSNDISEWFQRAVDISQERIRTAFTGFNTVVAEAMTAELGTMDGTSLATNLSDWFQRAVAISQERIRTAFTGFNVVVDQAMTAELGTMDGTSLATSLSAWFSRAVAISQDRIRTAFVGFNTTVNAAVVAEIGTMDGSALAAALGSWFGRAAQSAQETIRQNAIGMGLVAAQGLSQGIGDGAPMISAAVLAWPPLVLAIQGDMQNNGTAVGLAAGMGARDGIEQGGAMVSSALSVYPTLVTAISGEMEGEGTAVGIAAGNGVGAGIDQGASVVTAAIGAYPAIIGAIAGQMASQGEIAGRAAGYGVARGIASGHQAAVNAAAALANDVIAQLNRIVQPGSPSKVTTKIGLTIPQGLGLGIDRAAQGAIDSASRLATNVLDVLDVSKGMGKGQKAMLRSAENFMDKLIRVFTNHKPIDLNPVMGLDRALQARNTVPVGQRRRHDVTYNDHRRYQIDVSGADNPEESARIVVRMLKQDYEGTDDL